MGYKKAFVVDSSEIEGRLDPFYYKKEFLDINNELLKIKYVKFKNILKSIQNGEDTREYKENGVPYLKVANIKPNKLNFKNVVYINESSNKIDIKKGDILLTRKGTYGISHYINEIPNFSISSEVFCLKTKDINNQYLDIFLNSSINQKIFSRIKTGAMMGHLTQNVIKNILIPLPPKETQNKIIQIMDNAYKIKKENESKAKELLASIDTYLLDKLDITLPKEEKVVSFKVDSSEIFGSRFDPNYYKTYYKELEHSLNNARYKVNKLGNLTKNIASGSTPKSGGTDYLLNGKNYFLRLVNLDDDLNVNTKKALFISDEIHNGMLKRSQLKKGDLLFGIAGSIGKMAIVDYEIKANINQAIALLRFDNYVNNIFIAFILNSAICKIQIKQLKRPVAQPNLNITELKSIKIPLPPLPIQNEIASHIQSLRDEAKELKKEAKDILKSAKDEVEAIILKGDIK